ncbi:MAG: alpha/beta hydrolase [Propionibacteriales bacterium]|nr:alpha/beta hydrolase [Propionibacteriales bacterium]
MPTADVNGTEIYYEDEGRGPALLLVHGWGTSGRVWGAQQVDLIADHRVVTIDWRGCGRSGRPSAGNDIATVVNDLAAVITAADVEQPVVIGSSVGAAFATELALAHPGLVSGVVPVGGTAHWASQGMDLPAILHQLSDRRPGFVQGWVPNWFAPGASEALIAWTVRQILDAAPFIDGQVVSLSTYDPRPRLGALPVPIHYLHGELDAEIPVAVAEDCAAYTPGATVTVIPGCGHMPHQEQPAAFTAALRSVLDQLRPVAA